MLRRVFEEANGVRVGNRLVECLGSEVRVSDQLLSGPCALNGVQPSQPLRDLPQLVRRGLAASLWVVEFLVTMQESVTASLGRLKTGEHHPLDAGVEEFHRVLAEVATIR